MSDFKARPETPGLITSTVETELARHRLDLDAFWGQIAAERAAHFKATPDLIDDLLNREASSSTSGRTLHIGRDGLFVTRIDPPLRRP